MNEFSLLEVPNDYFCWQAIMPQLIQGAMHKALQA
jgi:hypothetical protein